MTIIAVNDVHPSAIEDGLLGMLAPCMSLEDGLPRRSAYGVVFVHNSRASLLAMTDGGAQGIPFMTVCLAK
ncbi:MAG: hypothetical protein R3Y11_04945 [Pseudomonadota bacterium]